MRLRNDKDVEQTAVLAGVPSPVLQRGRSVLQCLGPLRNDLHPIEFCPTRASREADSTCMFQLQGYVSSRLNLSLLRFLSLLRTFICIVLIDVPMLDQTLLSPTTNSLEQMTHLS